MALTDKQIERFSDLGVSNANLVQTANTFYTAGGTGNPLEAAYNAGSTTAQLGGNIPYGQQVGSPTVVTDPKTGIITTTYMYSNGTGGTYAGTPVVSQGPILPTGPTGSTGSTGPSAQTMQDRQNAIAALTATFNNYGLSGDISKAVTDMVQQGYTADTISLIAQDTTSTNPLAVAMQKRFPANKARLDAGLPPLSPAEYIAVEKSYRQVLSSNGLPTGFYDQTSDFTNFITKDISATELNNRVSLAAKAVANADPSYTSALQQMYGLSTGDMIAHVLDPSAALPLLQKQAAAVDVGTAAMRQGMTTSAQTAEQLAGIGITSSQAEKGFSEIAQQLPGMQSLASRYEGFGPASTVEQSLQAATFNAANPNETPAEATARLRRLQTQEVSQFGGSAGASTQGQSLGIANAQGIS